jgi:hypothetical protein
MPLSSAAAAASSTSLLSTSTNSTTPNAAASSNLEYTTTNIPAFLSKLWTLVEDERYNELIAWDPVKQILPKNIIKL